jgi:hypothetical protein
MSKLLRALLPAPLFNGLKTLRELSALLFHPSSYLHRSGFLKSHFSGYPCRPDGSALPWMNYAVIAFLEQRLNRDLSLFEYGSGFSTRFYAARVGRVTSVEHDRSWFEIVSKELPGNVRLIYQELNDDYPRQVLASGEKYDVVVVDGRERAQCAINACDALTEGGVIVFDDTKRNTYAHAYQHLQERGFRRLDFEGLKPTGLRIDRTSIFYRPDNCLGI